MKKFQTLTSELDSASLSQEFAFPAEISEWRRRVDAARSRLRGSRSVLFQRCGLFLLVLAAIALTVAVLAKGDGALLAGAAIACFALAVLALWLGDPRAVQRTADALATWLGQAQGRLGELIKRQKETVHARLNAGFEDATRELQCENPLPKQRRHLGEWAEQVDQRLGQVRSRRDAAAKSSGEATQLEAERAAELRRLCRSRWRFFRPGRVIARAASAFEAAEQAAHERHRLEELNAVVGVLSDLRSSIQAAGDQANSDLLQVTPMTAAKDKNGQIHDELWPPASWIEETTHSLVSQSREAILNALARRGPSVPLAAEIQRQAEELVTSHPEIVDSDMATHLGRLNGRANMLVLEATTLAREWARIDDSKDPLAARRRLTTLLVNGGTNSPLYPLFSNAIKGQLRAIDVPDTRMVGLVNETRFADIASFPRCEEAARVLEHTNDDLLGLSVIMEDIDEVKRYTPEQDNDGFTCERLLVLLRLLKLAERKGSIIALAPTHPACPVDLDGNRLGAGWDDALTRIRSDRRLRDWLASTVKGRVDQIGAAELRRLVDAALPKPDSVGPVERTSTITKVLHAVRAELKPASR